MSGKLSVEWNAENSNVEIVMDREGVQALIRACEGLLADGDHAHVRPTADSGIFERRFHEIVLELRDEEWPAVAPRGFVQECI